MNIPFAVAGINTGSCVSYRSHTKYTITHLVSEAEWEGYCHTNHHGHFWCDTITQASSDGQLTLWMSTSMPGYLFYIIDYTCWYNGERVIHCRQKMKFYFQIHAVVNPEPYVNWGGEKWQAPKRRWRVLSMNQKSKQQNNTTCLINAAPAAKQNTKSFHDLGLLC